MKVRLNKIKSFSNSLWRDWYTGHCEKLPTIGEQFQMRTYEEGELWTTTVQSYNVNFSSKTITFKTKNSEYELLLLEDA